MKVRTRLLIIVALSILLILGGTLVSSELLLMDTLETLEEDQAGADITRAGNLLGHEIENLQLLTNDWAAWDDTYAFVADPGDRYIRSNLVDGTFTGSRLDYILYFDTAGELVYGKAYDFREEEPAAVPQEIADQLRSHGLIGNPKTAMERTGGLLVLDDGPVEVALEPIIRSDDTGPARGKMLMGRRFNRAEVERLGEIASLDLSVEPWPEDAVSARSSPPPWFTRSVNGTLITAMTPVDDIFGNPALLMRVDTGRTLYATGTGMVTLFLMVVTIVGLAALGGTMYAIDRGFVQRLEQVKGRAEEIARSGDETMRVPVADDDEIGDLARSFNRTLDSLEEHIAREREATEASRRARKKLSVLSGLTRHDILNQAMVIDGNASLLADHLPDDPEGERHLSRISHASGVITDLIDFTRMYEKIGEQPPVWQSVDAIVGRVAGQVLPSDVALEIRTGGLQISCDPLLERVFYVLMENAVLHGGEVSTIRIRFEDSDRQGRLIVEDDGEGIPPEMKEPIFRPRVGRNTGMGLFLAREILSLSDMEIRETGEPGAGARFEILIPPGRYRRAGEESA